MTNLGCFGHCSQIDTTETAAIDGDYTLSTTFHGQKIDFTESFTAGADLVFSAANLNENYLYIANVIDPTGSVVNAEPLSFQILPQTNLNPY